MLLNERIKTLAPPGAVYVLARRRSTGLIEQPAQWSAISAVSGNSWLGQTLSAQRARRDDMVRSGQNRLPSGPLLISERNRPRLCAFRSLRLAAAFFTDEDCRALPCQQQGQINSHGRSLGRKASHPLGSRLKRRCVGWSAGLKIRSKP